MRAETRQELRSLATLVGAQAPHLLSLARLVSSDELLCSIDDLTELGAQEVIQNLKLYGRAERDWLAELIETA